MNQKTISDSTTSVCKICCKSIESGAKKCTECGSYQDWRRHFSVGTVTLSLIIALVSVSTTAIQVTKSLLAKEQSELKFSLVQYGPNHITIMSSNLGDRAGALKQATLNIRDNSETVKTYNLLWENVDLVIKPGSWRLFQMIPAINKTRIDLRLIATTDEHCTHVIEFDVLAFDHNPKKQTLEYKCPIL